MGRFIYQVRDGGGKTSTGLLTARTAIEAARMLRTEGKTVIQIHQEADVPASRAGSRRKRARHDDVIFFSTQLAVMVDTGVQLTEALDAIGEQCDSPGMKAVILDLSDRVKGGEEFSAALERHPRVFSEIFIALVKASEASGTMGQMLQRVSEYLSQERDTRKQVKGALIYPACMLVFCILVVVGLMIFVLPRFEKIYSGKGAILPLPTRILLGISHGLIGYWPIIVGLLVAAGAGAFWFLRSPRGKIFLDSLHIRLPVLGPMHRKACLARSLRTMATMVSTGVTMLEGLQITARVAGSHRYSTLWKDIAEQVKQGTGLAENLYRCDLVPRTISQMIDAGERTGRLAMVMNRVAQFCEDDLKVAVKTLTSMIEPAMIIIMGLVVGGIAMSLLLPVFSLAKIVAH